MAANLVTSLNIAVEIAKDKLDPILFKAIDKEFQGKGWPTTTKHYLEYIDLYLRLIPNESNDPEYPDSWKSSKLQNGYNRKVYDLLIQSWWLVDQKIPGTNMTMQIFPKFAKWLDDFAKAWGAFLDTEESLTEETLRSFKNDSRYNIHLFKDDEKNWKTFNNFFYREFNGADSNTGISPLRPIADPENAETIVSPADCTYKQYYRIDPEGHVLEWNGTRTRVPLKETHSIGTIDELLTESRYSSEFYGGTFIHYFLSPFDYHRFHAPVPGEVLEIAPVEGKVYVNIVIQEDGQFGAPDDSEDGYEFTQARGLVVMDAGPVVGKVAIVPVGMGCASGVDMYTELQGQSIVKGQEFGKFRFGGSDLVMLFQKPPTELYMFKNDPGNEPIHFQYGQTALYWNV